MMETYRGVVYPNQIDHMGHMNVQWHTEKFHSGTWHLFSEAGISKEIGKIQPEGNIGKIQRKILIVLKIGNAQIFKFSLFIFIFMRPFFATRKYRV